MLDLLFLLTPSAYASVDTFIKKINTYIINPVISFLIVLAIAYFLYGMFQFIKNGDSSDEREKGQKHMIWSSIGLFIMIGVFLIMKIILGTIGISEDEINPQTGEINIIDTINGNDDLNTVDGG